jgi:ureidoacrylate peracid hydrolase
MQNDFASQGGMLDRAGVLIDSIAAIVPSITRVVAAGRRLGLPVVYLKMGYQSDLSDMGPEDAPNRLRHLQFGVGQPVSGHGQTWRTLIRGGWGTEILDALKPEPDDLTVWKHRHSGFFETELDSALMARGIRNLVVTGCTTSVCVEATVRDAYFRNYRCLMLTDCMAEPMGADTPRTNHDASKLIFELLGWTSDSHSFVDAVAEKPLA